MRTIILTILLPFFCLAWYAAPAQDVPVDGYYKTNGTYVEPHMRSAPDKDPTNNWSYPGNVNPYTGKVAHGGYYGGYNSLSPNEMYGMTPERYNRSLNIVLIGLGVMLVAVGIGAIAVN